MSSSSKGSCLLSLTWPGSCENVTNFTQMHIWAQGDHNISMPAWGTRAIFSVWLFFFSKRKKKIFWKHDLRSNKLQLLFLLCWTDWVMTKVPSLCYTPRLWLVGCNSFDIVCLSVCVCVSIRLTLMAERTDIQTWILPWTSSGRISSSSL